MKKSKTVKSFTSDYGNSNGIKVKDIIKIFNRILTKRYNREFVATFNNPRPNKNVITRNKSLYPFYSKESSKNIIKNEVSKSNKTLKKLSAVGEAQAFSAKSLMGLEELKKDLTDWFEN